MMRTLHAPRSAITPTAPLDKLIRGRTALPAWSQLRDAIAARPWPPLVRPRWMRWLVYGLPLLTGAVVVVGLPSLADWAFRWSNTLGFVLSFTSDLRALVAIPLVIFAWVLLGRVSKRFNRALPRNLRTVGDLVPLVMTSAEMTWSREEIERQVRQIVVGQLQVPRDRYRAEGRFVEDFGLQAGVEKT